MYNSRSIVCCYKVPRDYAERIFGVVVWQGRTGPQLLITDTDQVSPDNMVANEVRDLLSIFFIGLQVIYGFDLLKNLSKHFWH